MEQEQWQFITVDNATASKLMAMTHPSQHQNTVVTITGVPEGDFVLTGDPFGSSDGVLGSRGPLPKMVMFEDLSIEQEYGTDPDDAGSLEELDGVETTIRSFIALFESLTLTDDGRDELRLLREALARVPKTREDLQELAEEEGEEEEEARRPRCNGFFDAYSGEVEHSGRRCPIHGVV